MPAGAFPVPVPSPVTCDRIDARHPIAPVAAGAGPRRASLIHTVARAPGRRPS